MGEVWWTLDYRHRMPVTLVHKDNLGGLDWREYTHLVLVGGQAGPGEPPAPALDEMLTDLVLGWVEDGGTLVATRDAAPWAQGVIQLRAEAQALENGVPESEALDDGTPGDRAQEDAATDADAETDATPERRNFGDMSLRDAEHVIGGAIFATDLDITHPLGFGFADRDLPVHRNVSFTLERPEGNPYAVPVQYTDSPLLTGYASERRLAEIAGTPSVIAQRMQNGAVILMADNPVFRGTFPGTEKVLMNAIFFSGLIDGPRGDYGAGE